MNKLTRISATVASSVALVAGFSGMASAHPYYSHDHGHNHHSNNKRIDINANIQNVENDTTATVTNSTDQTAESGDVTVSGGQSAVYPAFYNDDHHNNHHNNNLNVGDVTSGDATNRSTTSTDVTVSNNTQALDPMSSSDNHSPVNDNHHNGGSNTSLDLNLNYQKVENTNDVSVDNTTTQTAESGDVTVSGNGRVGDVTSGDASNTSNTSTSVTVRNTTN